MFNISIVYLQILKSKASVHWLGGFLAFSFIFRYFLNQRKELINDSMTHAVLIVYFLICSIFDSVWSSQLNKQPKLLKMNVKKSGLNSQARMFSFWFFFFVFKCCFFFVNCKDHSPSLSPLMQFMFTITYIHSQFKFYFPFLILVNIYTIYIYPPGFLKTVPLSWGVWAGVSWALFKQYKIMTARNPVFLLPPLPPPPFYFLSCGFEAFSES